MTFPVTAEQFEDDPPVVVVALDNLLRELINTSEWDGYTLTLRPDRADALAAALTSKAAAIRAGRIDIHFTEDDDA